MALTQSLKQPRQGTNTALGIDTMRQMFRSSGSRPNAPKVMIIITDGKSTNPQDTKDQALRAKAEGATIITVGIGGTHLFKDEINTIATNGKAFEVADYQSLTQIIQQLRDLICSGKYSFFWYNDLHIFWFCHHKHKTQHDMYVHIMRVVYINSG